MFRLKKGIGRTAPLFLYLFTLFSVWMPEDFSEQIQSNNYTSDPWSISDVIVKGPSTCSTRQLRSSFQKR